MKDTPSDPRLAPPADVRSVLLTPAEAAGRLSVSESLIYQLCSERRLPHYRIGGDGRRGKILIDEQELRAFIRSCRVEVDELLTDGALKHIR